GVEYCAILKNVYAIVAGLCQGLGYGDNFQSVLVCAAIQECQELLEHTNSEFANFTKSAYLGDLLVTMYSGHSRNRQLGTLVGRGYSTSAALIQCQQIPEGYYAIPGLIQLAQEKAIKMPILQVINSIIYHKYAPALHIASLSQTLN
ncbi:MAG: NAD(P)H-dependent glycerol-3-phosphate dehydrogenase, partial [Candidatus Thioglobus sp.]